MARYALNWGGLWYPLPLFWYPTGFVFGCFTPLGRPAGKNTQRIRRSLGLTVHRGWAKLLLDRCRDLVVDPRQPRTHAHETDEDDAEAHEYFHLHQTRGRGGHYRTRQD